MFNLVLDHEKFNACLKNQGLAIGNGWINPEIQYKSELDYALDWFFIEESQHDSEYATGLVAKCEADLKECHQSNYSFL